jgi:peroxiredoxin
MRPSAGAVLVGVFLAAGALFALFSRDSTPPPLASGQSAPAFDLPTLDGDARISLSSLRGRVVLLNFWTFTCWNCTGALPSLVAYDSLYRPAGLTIVGIHTPEFPPYGGEHDVKNLAAALAKHHLRYPNAQDNDRATWDLYGIRYWPSYVLIDRKGQIRWEGYGEFHVGDRWHAEWEGRIQTLLAEAA